MATDSPIGTGDPAAPGAGLPPQAEQEVAAPVITVEAPPGGIEREVFGKWTVLLRNVFGAITVWTLCLSALANAWTTNLSVKEHGQWPSEISMIIMNVGPIIVAWTWMNSNKTIATLMELMPLGNRIRSRMATAIAPKEAKAPEDTSS